MTVVLPVAVNERLVGSAVLVAAVEKQLLFATSLHLFGSGTKIQIAVPPHEGNLARVQPYPLEYTSALEASVTAADPFADLAILTAYSPGVSTVRTPSIVSASGLVQVGTEIVALGYPFAPLGSFLETWSPGVVTALARRRIAPGIEVDELVLSIQSHPGVSGSAVVGRNDGVLYGVIRGALAPPQVLSIGEIPIATDTSVTFATSAHALHDLLQVATTAAGR